MSGYSGESITLHFCDFSHFLIDSTDEGIIYDIDDEFTHKQEGYFFMPAFKNGLWDGNIRLFNKESRKMPLGLLKLLLKWCEVNGLNVKFHKSFSKLIKTSTVGFSLDEFTESLNLPFKMYEHQIDSINEIIKRKRLVILSATNSGKSLVIYTIIRLMIEKFDKTVLLIVPYIQLVEQMYKDFVGYGWDAIESNTIRIKSGSNSTKSKIIYINDDFGLNENTYVLINGKRKKALHIKEGDKIALIDVDK